MENPSNIADEITQLRWCGLAELVIHRFQDHDREVVLEVHRCRKVHAQSAQHFWIQSVLNRLDFTEHPGFFAAFVTDAIRRAATGTEVMNTYEGYRRGKHASVMPPGEAFTSALVMREDWNDFAAMLETPEEYFAIHWSTTA